MFLGESSVGVLKSVHLMNKFIINELQSSPGELDDTERKTKKVPVFY